MGKIMSWLTGRDEKESDVYANYDKVEQVVSSIKSIGTNEVEAARDAVHEAINELNNVNGVAQYVGNVDAGGFDGVFESITAAMTQIGDQIQAKANDIKTYEESAWYEKLGSTFAMAGAKLGEGILSVGEDLGDGVVSLVGWIAPKDSGLEKSCKNFVDKEWSHDAFNFYYNSEFAKKSTFTEDSGAAGAFKLIGNTAGYLALGGAIAGAGGAVAGKTAGAASKAGKAAHAAGTFLSSTTRVNTITAGLSGMGSGTESGIRQGLSFDDAAKAGAKQGATQAAVAYTMGKLGEKNAKKQAVDEATGTYEKAKEGAKTAKEGLEAAKKDVTKAQDTFDAAKAHLDDMKTNYSSNQDLIDQATGFYQDAEKGLNAAKAGLKTSKSDFYKSVNEAASAKTSLTSAKNATYQGYNDSITKLGQKAGDKYATSVMENGFLKTTVGTPLKAAGKATVAGVKGTASTIRHPVQSAKNAFNATKSAAASGKNAVKTASTTIKTGASNAKTGVINAVKTPHKVHAAVELGKSAVKTAVTSPVVPGVVGAAANSTGRSVVASKGNAAVQFKKTVPNIEKADNTPNINENVDYSIGKKARVIDTNNSGNSSNNSTNTGGSNGGGGGSRSGGGGGGSTGGGYSPTSTASTNPGSGSEQFKKTKTVDDGKDKTPEKKQTLKTPTETKKPTTTPTTNPTTPTTKPTTPTTNPSNPTTPTTNPSTPTTPSNNDNRVVNTAPSNSGGTTTQHTGGGYSASGGYRGYSGGDSVASATGSGIESVTDSSSVEDVLADTTTSIDDVIKGSKYTKIPTSSKPISTTATGGSGGSAVIPVVAGLSAAAAAGVGAKVYMDRKKNNENGEYDEIETEEWSGDDALNIDYDDSSDTETYLDEDDDYSYQAEEQTEKYDARNNEELADLQ